MPSENSNPFFIPTCVIQSMTGAKLMDRNSNQASHHDMMTNMLDVSTVNVNASMIQRTKYERIQIVWALFKYTHTVSQSRMVVRLGKRCSQLSDNE